MALYFCSYQPGKLSVMRFATQSIRFVAITQIRFIWGSGNGKAILAKSPEIEHILGMPMYRKKSHVIIHAYNGYVSGKHAHNTYPAASQGIEIPRQKTVFKERGMAD